MATVKLTSKLPDGQANGLTAIYSQLVNQPDGLIACYVLLDVKSITDERDTEETIPLTRVRHIEPVAGGPEAREVAQRLLYQRETRLKRKLHATDLGDELVDLLGVDPDTGELIRLDGAM